MAIEKKSKSPAIVRDAMALKATGEPILMSAEMMV